MKTISTKSLVTLLTFITLSHTPLLASDDAFGGAPQFFSSSEEVDRAKNEKLGGRLIQTLILQGCTVGFVENANNAAKEGNYGEAFFSAVMGEFSRRVRDETILSAVKESMEELSEGQCALISRVISLAIDRKLNTNGLTEQGIIEALRVQFDANTSDRQTAEAGIFLYFVLSNFK